MSKLVVKFLLEKTNISLSVKSNETANKTAKTSISSKERTQKFKNKMKMKMTQRICIFLFKSFLLFFFYFASVQLKLIKWLSIS